MDFQSVQKLVTLSVVTLNSTVTVIARYFTQCGSFQGQLRYITESRPILSAITM